MKTDVQKVQNKLVNYIYFWRIYMCGAPLTHSVESWTKVVNTQSEKCVYNLYVLHQSYTSGKSTSTHKLIYKYTH